VSGRDAAEGAIGNTGQVLFSNHAAQN